MVAQTALYSVGLMALWMGAQSAGEMVWQLASWMEHLAAELTALMKAALLGPEMALSLDASSEALMVELLVEMKETL